MPRFTITAFLVLTVITATLALAQQPTLATVAAVRCSFTVMTAASLRGDAVKPEVKPSTLTLEFEAINADEGTAQVKSKFSGIPFDIIVRHTKGYLHFIQAYYEGPLYVTTILDRKTTSGKWKAMHSRHEYTDVALPGYTSSPEQYYGECEATR
jgi:hypothetical protein